MLTTIFTDDRNISPREPLVLEDDVLWKDYADRVIGICETLRARDRDRKAMGQAGSALISAPSQFPGLDKIVKIKHDTRTALVEANITMGTLVDALRPLHFIPTVVAESRSTTVANAFAATTNASSSSRFGTFDCSVMAAGVVLGNGQFATSSIDDSDGGELLQRSAGSLHSLGITSMLEISLIKAGPYVEVSYTPVPSISETLWGTTIAATQCAQIESPINFVEGIILERCSGMIITGRQVLVANKPVSQALAKGNDFTKHVRSIWRRARQPNEPYVELLPVEDYLFRHEERRSKPPVPNQRRSWPAGKPSVKTVTAGPVKFLDFAISASAAQEILQSLIAAYDSWPIWICPVSPPKCFGRSKTFSLEPAADKLLLNIGFWGSTCASDGCLFESKRLFPISTLACALSSRDDMV
jgi:delta24-sterol reductase